jgi:hypothetical protein
MPDMTREQLQAVIEVLDGLAKSYECCTGNHPQELHSEANRYRAQLAALPPQPEDDTRQRMYLWTLSKIYEIATGMLADPPESDTGLLVDICTLVEAAAQGKLPPPDLRAALVEAKKALAVTKRLNSLSLWHETITVCGSRVDTDKRKLHEAVQVADAALARIDAVLEVKP